ncbi:hypothetical protein H2248_012348 [Termitomyces sp. 'cryptogamus']|nr:hypothetical protein H2248_012348 [Termitomyces sp. 'cryptogamus']
MTSNPGASYEYPYSFAHSVLERTHPSRSGSREASGGYPPYRIDLPGAHGRRAHYNPSTNLGAGMNPLQRPHQTMVGNVVSRFVRIQYFATLDQLRERQCKNPVQQGVVSLDDHGHLDFQQVKEIFDIGTCLPVHPIWWKIFEPVESDKLGKMAVHVLSQLGVISFVSG